MPKIEFLRETEKIKNVLQNHLCTLKFSTPHNTTLSLSLSLSLSHQRATNGSFFVVDRVLLLLFLSLLLLCVLRERMMRREEKRKRDDLIFYANLL